MARYSNINYITIPGFAITQLGLAGNELVLYSLIYGFSQDGESMFYGSLSYIAGALNITRRTALTLLNNLVGKGFLEKSEIIDNGVKVCHYSCTARSAAEVDEGRGKNFTGGEKNSPGCGKNFTGGSEKFSPHIDNTIDRKEEYMKRRKESAARFVAPTLDEVGEYLRERGVTDFSAAQFWNHYESNGWKVGKASMKDWKAAVRTWILRREQTPPPTPSPAGGTRHYYVKDDSMTAMMRRWGVLDQVKSAAEGACDEQ